MHARILAVPFLLAAGCTYPQFESTRSVDFTLPAHAIREIACESHNGGIKVNGNPAATEIAVHVDITVRGRTQAEADANQDLLDVGREESGAKLRLFGKIDPELPNNTSPSFAWRLEIPQRMDLDLVTHNGSLTVRDTEGKVAAQTHNGGIDADVRTADVGIVTHNGHVKLNVDGDGPLQGKVESHNGGIEVAVGANRSTTIDADTHNGRIRVVDRAASFGDDRSSARVQVGEGKGRLAITTHNGGVEIR
ncbi:MAG TPA: hypothetical protein VFZ65_03835 [Planctomycetota bacterium]|nr:hypothetical protein [Planctomycetota bacterium]